MLAADLICEEDCKTILKPCIQGEFKVVGFHFELLEDHVEGFLSSSRKLIIEYQCSDSCVNRMCFFAKILPKSNDFHEKYVLSTGGFEKEVFFFDKIKPKLDEWSRSSVLPKCYLTLKNKIVVMELLAEYRVKDIAEYYNTDDIQSCIRSLAIMHAASLMYESKNNLNLIDLWGDYFYDAIYLRKEGHMGFRHMRNGIEAIKKVIHENFPEFSDHLKQKVYDIYDSLPEIVKESKKYRNVISHGDLYTNNLMFPNNPNGEVKIIDFQLFRFNPPSFDLLIMIYLTLETKSLHDVTPFTDYYYECLSTNLTHYGFNPDKELPRKEFDESVLVYKAASVAISLLFQHYVNLPPKILKAVMNDPDLLKKFMAEDRRELVASSFQLDDSYRNKLSSTISLLFECCST